MKKFIYSQSAENGKRKNFSAITLFAALLMAFTALPFSKLFSNNLRITNIVTTQNASPGGTVQFDISWENSWNLAGGGAPSNWDAVWVFVKFRDCTAGASPFTHGLLSSTMSTHTLGANLQAMTTGDGNTPSYLATASAPMGALMDYSGGTGIMLRRSATTTGAVTTSQTGVVLNITNLPANTASLNVRVEGIEMVYVLPGDFSIGDGDGGGANFSTNGSPNRFARGNTNTTSDCQPMLVNNTFEGSSGTSTFYMMSTQTTPTQVTGVPNTWPKGQYGFYLMKYEISQGLYTEFLNTIGATPASSRYDGTNFPYTSRRMQVFSGGGGSYYNPRPDRAMAGLCWDDLAAFLDWACLRPMTETEFEKAARGPSTPVLLENVWGTAGTPVVPGTMNAPLGEDGTEVLLSGQCNFASVTISGGDGGNGPLRNGIFATPSTNRSQSGAGYYGAMELGGNVKEFVVAMNSTGSSNTFTRTWGDGTLSAGGSANNLASWPGPSASITSGNSFTRIIGVRGGDAFGNGNYQSSANELATSSRIGIYDYSTYGVNTANTATRVNIQSYNQLFGGRGAR